MVKVERLRSLDYEREVMGAADEVVEEVVADIVGRIVKCADGDDHFMDERRVEVAATNEVVHGGNVESQGGNEHMDEGIVMDGMNGSTFGGVEVCDVLPLWAVSRQSGCCSDVAVNNMTNCGTGIAHGDCAISIFDSEVQALPDVVECVTSVGGKNSPV
ncbi:hypothetical protein LOK49_LG06G02117 [Camellia lanceoleosa]|uniref:Uncharacterized protein n=1 Tax=Camellia lanceoleosa TaxID=1840588 RepID=A0ACC0HB80_9ERIC|nr:hypothetical protein LOK49_LG06G02117 [Camellia lanceoleosa]